MRPPNSTQQTPAGHDVQFYAKVGVDGEKQTRRYMVSDPPGSKPQRLPSATTVVGIFDKSRPFVRKALHLASEGLDWYTHTDEAAARGTAAHGLIVRMMADDQVGSLADLDVDHRPWGQQAAAWLLAREPELIEAERFVVGPGYCGTFDLLCELDGIVNLIDFKTTKQEPVRWKNNQRVGLYPPYTEDAFQLSAYALGCEYSGYPVPERLAIVRLWPGGYDEVEVPYQPDRFLSVLNAYRAKLDYDRELKAAMKAALEQAV